MRRGQKYLFTGGRLLEFLQEQKQRLRAEVDGFGKDYLLNTPTEDLCDYLEDKYYLHAPQVSREGIHIVGHGEADIDVSQDKSRPIRDRSKPFYVKGRYVEFAVPFEGNPDLFHYEASTFWTIQPYGRIEDNEVRFRYERLDHDQDALKSKFERDLDLLQKHVEGTARDVAGYNGSLRSEAKTAVERRKERLLEDENMVASLGYPIKRRDDAPQTYSVPVSRKKPKVRKPPAATEPFEPEPILAMTEYEEILGIMESMVDVMERSPKAFVDMEEEDLRTHFLVQLNGQYEGRASGETFNYEGRTDILIRTDGKNVFIAECKFWKGPKGFVETIDQLLGYASWRDTKTAIVLFNRNKNLTPVLKKIPATVKEHPNFKREQTYESETGFRFVLHQKNDVHREIILTVLVFDVPIDL